MPSPIKGIAGVAAGLVADQAMKVAQNPEVRQAVAEGARAVASKAKLPPRTDPFDRLEHALETIDTRINQSSDGMNTATVTGWRNTLASLRRAVPLAKADQGKGRKQKLKDLEKRQHALLDEIYAATVADEPAQDEA